MAALQSPPAGYAGATQTAAPALLSVRQQTSQMVRAAIYEGLLAPGDRLTERQICERFGVSRTVAREVVRELEAERLIESNRRDGVTVAKMDDAEIRDLYDVRILLEARACELCARRMTPEIARALDDAMAAIAASARSGNRQDQRDANGRFYDEIFAAAGNVPLRQILKGLHGRVSYLRTVSMSQPGRPAESLKEIEALLTALKKGDAAEAARLSTVHIEAARTWAFKALADRKTKPGASS